MDVCDTALVRELGATIRQSCHGVLVSSGCPLPGMCSGLRPGVLRSPGTMVFVQLCSPDTRLPHGDALLIEPIRTQADLSHLQAWLLSASFDPTELPEHLTPQAARTSAHQMN